MKIKFVLMFFLILPTYMFSQIENAEDSLFLKATRNIDCDNSLIIDKANEVTHDLTKTVEKVKALFEYVNKTYSLESYDETKASEILIKGGNSCIKRSSLMIAMCRAVGIPARLRLHLVDLKDFTYDGKHYNSYKFPHGIAEVKVNGEWYQYEMVGNKDKWNLWNSGKTLGEDINIKFKEWKNCFFIPNKNVSWIELPIYFSDRDGFFDTFINNFYSAEIGYIN